MKTIDELKETGFIVEEWMGVTYNGRGGRSGGTHTASYTFKYENSKLYVCDGAFGKTVYEVLNALEVLFRAANNYATISVKLNGLSFDIYNAIIK